MPVNWSSAGLTPYCFSKTDFMKAIFTSLLLLVLASITEAQVQRKSDERIPQWQVTSGVGLQRMTGLKSDMDEQFSVGIRFDINYNIRLSGNHYLTVGAGYEDNTHIVDGYFSRPPGSGFIFGRTPDDFKQHQLELYYLHLPIVYKFRWVNNGTVSIGAYGNYLLGARSKFKIQSVKFDNQAPIENDFQWGLKSEMEVFSLPPSKRRMGSVFGLGAQYQLSDHLKTGSSFKPLFAYVKLGFTLK
jgi:hypothetical protein